MKKKLIALVAALVMMLTMVGCSADAAGFVAKLNEVQAWEAVDMSGNVGLTMTVGAEKIDFNAQVEGYMIQNPLQAEMTLTFDEFTVPGMEQAIKLAPMKCYMYGLKVYFSTSYLKDIVGDDKEAEEELSTVLDLSKEYIAMDMTSTMAEAGIDISDMAKYNAECYKMLEGLNVDVPIVKEGDKYSIALDDSKLVDVIFELMKSVMTTPEYEASMKQSYTQMGLTEAEIEMAQAQLQVMFSDETKATVKGYVTGSNASLNYNFGKDSYDAEVALDIKANVGELLGENIGLKMTEKISAKKAAKKAIVFPTSVATYDYKELLEQMMAELTTTTTTAVYEVEKAATFEEAGVTYVPFKAAVAAAGYSVGYDSATKTTFIEAEGQQMTFPTVIKAGVSYISIETAAQLGIEVVVK